MQHTIYMVKMSNYRTTTGDAYRDPRTYQPDYAIQANENAREHRRKKDEHNHGHYDFAPQHTPFLTDRFSSFPQRMSSLSYCGNMDGSSSKLNTAERQIGAKHKVENLRAASENMQTVQTHYTRSKSKGQEVDGEAILQLEDQIRATIYGHCIGDAIGLLTEFMSKDEAQKHYGMYGDKLELEYKIRDSHRSRWSVGDWTDDSDQMILIMQSLTDNNGKVFAKDFASRLKHWTANGFEELGDRRGLGIGHTTYKTVICRTFATKPHKAAKQTWTESNQMLAPNGGVMRTSILGIHEFWDLEKVVDNATTICATTHCDPRCQASAVAVCVAIALMLQKAPPYVNASGEYDIDAIIQKCLKDASLLLTDNNHVTELERSLRCTDLATLQLDEETSIGYTFKCLGAGFWALKQNDFRTALTKIVMNGGDADTNGAVAGALLACKLQKTERLPNTWYNSLTHRLWLNEQIKRYLKVFRSRHREMSTSKSSLERSDQRPKRKLLNYSN